MKNLKSKMNSGPFDYAKTIRGFNVQLYLIQRWIFEYMYELAFKNRFEFLTGRLKEHLGEQELDAEFFLHSEDPWVIHTVHLHEIIRVFQERLQSYFGISARKDLDEQLILEDSERHLIYRREEIKELHEKNYKQLQGYYKRTVIRVLKYVCYMAKVFEREDEQLSKGILRYFELKEEYMLGFLDLDNKVDTIFFDLIRSMIPYVQMLDRGDLAQEEKLDASLVNVARVNIAESRYLTLADFESEADYLRALGLERVNGVVGKLAVAPEVNAEHVATEPLVGNEV